ncbi:unnamed protein product [Pseudo-nitzschia multistriata]|uniref:rhomboid protease n=1 Tax=Pseudo-nitzschia multistriata TaxID=183589 RepID=A0A448ZIZ7_9STRA|nr:unnamed protein product [Pseudo-nitzschia multistriata]
MPGPCALEGSAENTTTADTLEDCIISQRTLSLPATTPPSLTLASSPTTIPSQTKSRAEGNEDNSGDTRAIFFLQCFTDVLNTSVDPSTTVSNEDPDVQRNPDAEGSGYYSDDEEGQIKDLRNWQRNPNNRRDTKLNYADEESEVGVMSNDGNTEDLLTPSLLDDDIVIQFLRSCSFETNHHNRSQNSVAFDGGPTSQGKTLQQQREFRRNNPTVVSFFKFFKFAQMERMKKNRKLPYMILGLFSNLSDIRSDLKWAQDAAYRRHVGEPYIAWADYYAKERKGILKRPIFISITLFISSFMMLWAFYKNKWAIEPLKSNPLIGPTPQVLLELGALQGRALIEDGKWWLLVTPIFLHAGIAHFLMNAAFLIFVCRTIERNHGWLHTGILFIVSGMFANAISALIQPGYILVGASGGIYGLIGTCVGDIVLNSRFFFLVLEERVQEETCDRERQRTRILEKGFRFPCDVQADEGRKSTETMTCGAVQEDNPFDTQCRHRRRVRLWCYFSIVCDLLLNSLVGLLPFVDNFAHLGGLIFGFFVSLSSLRLLSASSFDYRKRQQKTTFGQWCHRLRILTLRCGGMISALLLVFVAILCLRRSDGMVSPCPNCRYASCISLPRFWKPNDTANWWTCDGCGGVAAQVYSGTGMNMGYYVSGELFCPQGNIVELDLSEFSYTRMEQVNRKLPDLCRKFCE